MELDGVDLMPVLASAEKTLPERDLFWKFYDTQSAVRRGDMKWTRVDRESGFFNVVDELDESTDLSAKYPEKLDVLKSRWKKWNERNAAPIQP